MKIFLISPVTLSTPEIERAIEIWINMKKEAGDEVYYPLHNTHQNVPIDLIMQQNKRAMERANKVVVFYLRSYGICFDLGMAYAMGKDIEVLNVFELMGKIESGVKSMESFVLSLDGEMGGWR